MCSDDINTNERYWIRSTPHTMTLRHLIDVESRLIYSSFFGGVSKVATHLDYDVLYLDVHLTRVDQIIFFNTHRRCSSTPRWSLHSTSMMINVVVTYRGVVGDINVFSSCLSIPRSTKKHFEMCSILEQQHCCSGYELIIV